MDKKPLISKWLAVGIIFLFVGICTITSIVQSDSINILDQKHLLTITAGNWTEIQKLIPFDGELEGEFGASVSLDGDTVLIGATGDGHNGYMSGAVYVYTLTNNTWTFQAKLYASDGKIYDQFGCSVSLSGDTALIGADGFYGYGNNTGSAYVFIRSGTIWTQQAKLLPFDGIPNERFGCSVALCGDIALIGASNDDENGNYSGSVYVFTRTGTTWAYQTKLLALDGAAVDCFGDSLSLSEDTALIGARFDDDNGVNSGSVYVFSRSGAIWTQQAKLLASDGASCDWFGCCVSLVDDTALIGSLNSRSAYVFIRTGTTWTQQTKLIPLDGPSDDFFGESVALCGDTALIGARGYNDYMGSAYVFSRTGINWTNQEKLLASDGAAYEYFGYSVALDSDTAFIGAFGDDYNKGSAYVFINEKPPNPPTINGPSSGKAKQNYEYSIVTTNLDGSNVSYYVDWGDDTNTGWIGLFHSGQIILVNHTWNEKRTYTIQARAKNIYGYESDWATLTVSIPFSFNILDPGWISGPIWGRIDGYEFRGSDNESLVFYAKSVHYFGIGHAFDAGLYPRHWVHEDVSAYYSHFRGIITEHLIFGKISGLPNQ